VYLKRVNFHRKEISGR